MTLFKTDHRQGELVNSTILVGFPKLMHHKKLTTKFNIPCTKPMFSCDFGGHERIPEDSSFDETSIGVSELSNTAHSLTTP